jgi:hypothetical protein
MFAVALLPDRRDDDFRLLCQQARLQLRVRLAPEPVAYPNRVLLKSKIFRHRQPLHSFRYAPLNAPCWSTRQQHQMRSVGDTVNETVES